MRLIGNIIWMLFGGIFTAMYWFLVDCLFSITIVGIPLGLKHSRCHPSRSCRSAPAYSTNCIGNQAK